MNIDSVVPNALSSGRFRSGQALDLVLTNPGHLQAKERNAGADSSVQPSAASKSFGELLTNSLEDVSQNQITHEQLAIQGIIDPDSVDVHDITIAAAKADLSLQIARNVVDRLISGYREITSLR